MPAEHRRALVLYYVCDLSVGQIATETGVPHGTVKARLARGRAALAPHLRESAGPGIPAAGAHTAAGTVRFTAVRLTGYRLAVGGPDADALRLARGSPAVPLPSSTR